MAPATDEHPAQRHLEVDKRFPDGAVQRVRVLQYGDEPMIEPGELLVRLIVAAADGPAATPATAPGWCWRQNP